MDAVSGFISGRRDSDQIVVEGELRVGSGNMALSKRKRGRLSPMFTLDGPFAVETEDVDDSILELVLSPKWLVEINIPSAASQAEFRLARLLGKQLAKLYQGVVHDAQANCVVWPKRRPKLYVTPQNEESIEVLNLCWYLPYSRRDTRTAKLFVDTVRKNLFECLPRRYGLFEPFQGKAEAENYDGFYALWDDAASAPYGDSLHFSSSAPCFGGHVSFSDPRDDVPRNLGAEKMVKVSVDIDGRALVDESWREAAVSLLCSFARVSCSFFAVGYIETGVGVKGRNLYFTGNSQRYPLPRHNRWLGLPSVPVWLTWFGYPYSDLVESADASKITNRFSEGFLWRSSEEALGIDALPEAPPEIPSELQAKLSDLTMSGRLASSSGPSDLSDDRMFDRPADFIPELHTR